MQETLKKLWANQELINKLLETKNTLKKSSENLYIADFDDTIFCRKEQLEQSELLRTNRWAKWNQAILDTMWIDVLAKDFYEWKTYPNCVTSLLRENHDLILTAGIQDIQNAKLKATQLTHINTIVTLHAVDKIIALISYVIFELKFLPKEITVFEDRPQFFIEYRSLIEELLETKLIIKHVTMNSNHEPINMTDV